MAEYPVLYKVNKNGSVSKWAIQVADKGPALSTVITAHGLLQGKQNVHEHDITEGKVGRTASEQAHQFARRKWTDKKEKELMSVSEPSASAQSPVTNSQSKSIRPMLAQTFQPAMYAAENRSRVYKIEFPAYVQPKLDGIRCLASHDNAAVYMESRKGTPYTHFADIKADLVRLFQGLPESFHFDGELYCTTLPFEEISGLTRLKELKQGDADRLKQIEYHIYDYVDTARPETPFYERLRIMQQIAASSERGTKCKFVATTPVVSAEQVKARHDEYVAQGYEGIMVRASAGVYEDNKRSRNLQKYKEFEEEEFRITGFREGTGDSEGLVIWECATKEGKEFRVVPRGTFEYKRQLFIDGAKYVGKQLTVKFQGLSEDGVPRFPTGKDVREDY